MQSRSNSPVRIAGKDRTVQTDADLENQENYLVTKQQTISTCIEEIDSRQISIGDDYFVHHVRSWLSEADNGVDGCKTANDHVEFLQQAFKVMKKMRQDSVIKQPKYRRYLRRYPERKLLVLDLDETLVYGVEAELPFSNLTMEKECGKKVGSKVVLRPYATQFLQKMSEHFEVVVMTAALKYYADAIVELLDPNRSWISDVLYRESCSMTALGHLVKDLEVFSPVSMKNIVLVDNSP